MSRRPASGLCLALLALLAGAGVGGGCGGGGGGGGGAGPAEDDARPAGAATAGIPGEDLLLRVTTGATEVSFGVAFPLTVVRVWSKDLVLEEWSDAVLAPLVVRLAGTTRREDDRRVEETRRYRAWAFRAGSVTVPAPFLRAKPRALGPDEPSMRVALADDIELAVLSALPPGLPGSPELPCEPFPAPFRWLGWPLLAALWVAGFSLLASDRRRQAGQPGAPSGVPPPAPHVRALERLRRLRERSPHGHAELRADSVEASSVVRGFVEERFSVCAPEMTTDEFLAAEATVRALRAEHRELLSEFLRVCDLVKFARHAPTAAEREGQLDAAAAFVRESADISPAESGTVESGTVESDTAVGDSGTSRVGGGR